MKFDARAYDQQRLKLREVDYDELRDKLAEVADWVQRQSGSVNQLLRALEYCAVWFDEEGHIRRENENDKD